MPEGPSIIILKEAVSSFAGKKVTEAKGNALIDFEKIKGQKLLEFKTWGKHFLICFKGFYLRIHLLMFGTYRVNERRDSPPRLHLKFKNGEINFYACNVKLFEGDPEDEYDMQADVMSDAWNAGSAEKKLKQKPDAKICDALLDQAIFSGVGNIIKNEVLFRVKVHPLSVVSDLPARKLKQIVKESVKFSFDFYNWKKANKLTKNLLVYEKKICPQCDIKLKKKYLGKGKRLTCFCENCQVFYKK